MTNLDKEAVIAAFTSAYEAKHGSTPTIEAKSGWYSVEGGKNIRLAQLQEMTQDLVGGTASKDEKRAPIATKKAPKKAAPSTANKKGQFSVKDFWANKLREDAPGSTLPR
jgi:hypothetical protein